MTIHLPRKLDLIRSRKASAYHFWIIVSLISAITILYYSWQNWFPWFWPYFIFEFKYNLIGVLLFIIPFAYASIVYWWIGSLIIWIISIMIALPLIFYYYHGLAICFLRNIIFFVTPIAAIIITATKIEWSRKQKELSVEREKERRVYLKQILQTLEEEKGRIAQELHDDTIQTLVALASNARSALSDKRNTMNPEVRAHIEWTRDTSVRLAEDVRRLSLGLRPSLLDDMGLFQALAGIVEDLRQHTGIDIRLTLTGDRKLLKPEEDVTIFRIVEEALNNIKTHSKATRSDVVLEFTPYSVKLSIQDNGVGFNLRADSHYSMTQKWGLIGMRERARTLNGHSDIISSIGNGTRLLFEFPN